MSSPVEILEMVLTVSSCSLPMRLCWLLFFQLTTMSEILLNDGFDVRASIYFVSAHHFSPDFSTSVPHIY